MVWRFLIYVNLKPVDEVDVVDEVNEVDEVDEVVEVDWVDGLCAGRMPSF